MYVIFALFNYDDDFEAILILLLAFLPCVAINLNAETVLLRIGQDAKVARCVNSFFSNPLHAEFNYDAKIFSNLFFRFYAYF